MEQIPAKLEGLTFGPDVELNGNKVHTLWISNDNDFLEDYSGPGTNPNQFFVFSVSDEISAARFTSRNNIRVSSIRPFSFGSSSAGLSSTFAGEPSIFLLALIQQ